MKSIFFRLSPFLVFSVIGNSMYPEYTSGDKVLVKTWFVSPAVSDVVVLYDPRTNTVILKRITKISNNSFGGREKEYYVVGDNKEESTDSRTFGWVKKKYIVGKVVFPKA